VVDNVEEGVRNQYVAVAVQENIPVGVLVVEILAYGLVDL
jgi:hypothetical protein